MGSLGVIAQGRALGLDLAKLLEAVENVGLAEQARNADASLDHHIDRGGYVTGQIARVDLRTGTATMVNVGHPHPLRLRDGRVEAIELVADPTFGLYRGHEYRGSSCRCRRATG